MTPEQQAVVDRLMGLASDCTGAEASQQEAHFAVGVAARKWAGLLAEGHQMRHIAFSGPKGDGTIDRWGKVLWAAQQADARDAARYRWLRDHGFRYADVDLDPESVVFRPRFSIPEPAGMSYEDGEWTLDDIDAALDAAMAASKKEG